MFYTKRLINSLSCWT